MLWHMDDLKASCTNSWEITKLFLYLKKIYWEVMTVQRGEHIEYFGMNFDYLEEGIFRVSVIPFVDKIMLEFLE